MKNGFVKIALSTPKLVLGEPIENAKEITNMAMELGISSKFIVFPGLCLTGVTLDDLFLQKTILENVKKALIQIKKKLKGLKSIVVVGAPIEMDGRIYDCGVVFYKGEILGIVPKKNINKQMSRYFASSLSAPEFITIDGASIPVGSDLIFKADDFYDMEFKIAVGDDIKEDANKDLSMLIHLGEECHIIGGAKEQASTLEYISKENSLIIASINPGEGESTTDYVYSGVGFVYENGNNICKKGAFSNKVVEALVDIEKCNKKDIDDTGDKNDKKNKVVTFNFNLEETSKSYEELKKLYPKTPFIDEFDSGNYYEEILNIQVSGLKRRLKAVGCKSAVVGISGGLDSTLAFLVTAMTFDEMGINRKNIIAVTMPCFGTSDRTYKNACSLIKLMGATFKEINIADSVKQHFADISHSIDNQNATYENAQARERTQVLMDIANDNGGIVVGTGDMSELALGWATYNGDHMSMYGVNSNIPKTLVKAIVSYIARISDKKSKEILLNIVDTPVSPELLPTKDGEIVQKTEDKVGPYVLHDFFMYVILKYRFTPTKVFDIATLLFENDFDKEEILKWEKVFYKRFFASQYKRSCMPDGPKILDVGLSPRGDLKMPSDIMGTVFMSELDKIKI